MQVEQMPDGGDPFLMHGLGVSVEDDRQSFGIVEGTMGAIGLYAEFTFEIGQAVAADVGIEHAGQTDIVEDDVF